MFEDLVDPKIVKILKLLVANKGKHYHLQKIASDSKVPIASTFRIMSQLVSFNVVEVSVIGKMKIYKIADNKKIRELEFVFKEDNKNEPKK